MTDLEHVTSDVDEQKGEWMRVCRLDQLTPDRGVAAYVRGHQVALFRLSTAEDGTGSAGDDGADEVFAIANRDPFSGAQVLARGIVGDAAGTPKVASPVYKQSFDLRTGRCLDDPAVGVATYDVRIDDGWVLVEVPE